jgi:hypothetical protein
MLARTPALSREALAFLKACAALGMHAIGSKCIILQHMSHLAGNVSPAAELIMHEPEGLCWWALQLSYVSIWQSRLLPLLARLWSYPPSTTSAPPAVHVPTDAGTPAVCEGCICTARADIHGLNQKPSVLPGTVMSHPGASDRGGSRYLERKVHGEVLQIIRAQGRGHKWH